VDRTKSLDVVIGAVSRVIFGLTRKVARQDIQQPVQIRLGPHLINKTSVSLNPLRSTHQRLKNITEQVGMDRNRIHRVDEHALNIPLGPLLTGHVMFHIGISVP